MSVQPSLEQVRPWWVLEGEHASPGLICTRDAANSGESLWLGKVSVEEDGTEGVVVSVRLWHLGKGIAGEERPFTAKAEELAGAVGREAASLAFWAGRAGQCGTVGWPRSLLGVSSRHSAHSVTSLHDLPGAFC